jgi:hypothetical protein
MIVRNTFAALVLAAAIPAQAVDYTDIWYNAAESGWGVNLVQSDAFIFGTFFVYAPNGTATWYSAELTWDGSGAYKGNLYATTGTGFALKWEPGNLTRTAVGTASFTPSTLNAYEGTLAWTVNGVGSATKPVERLTLTGIALGGDYTGGQTGAYSGCSTSSENGSYIDRYDLQVTHEASGAATFEFSYTSGLTCTLSGTLELHGGLYRIPGATYKCSDGVNTTATMYEIKATALGIEGRLASSDVGGRCQENANFAAVLH